MENLLFWLIIGIIIFDFIFEKYLDYLNIKSLKEELPKELSGIYDKDKYKKSQLYEKETSKFSLVSSIFSLLIILGMLSLGGFTINDEFVRSITDNEYFRTLAFFGILGLAFDLVSLPFQIYSTFVIEEKYVFNKTTSKTLITDKLKSWLITVIIGGALMCFILWAWLSLDNLFVPVVLAGLTAFMIFMAMFYSSLIVPLFNKLLPLEDGSLKQKISDFADKCNFRLKNIYTIDGSKRSTKANAYFSGFGPKKMIVLFDTLIKDLSEDEIVAVLAHEVGHYKKKHIYKGLVISIFQSAAMLFLLSIALEYPAVSKSIGAVEPSFYMGIIAFGLLYSPISFLIGISTNKFSRSNEFEADEFAREYGFGEHLINSLKKLSVNNLSNLTPHKLYVFFHYSHPTLLQRIAAIKKKY